MGLPEDAKDVTRLAEAVLVVVTEYDIDTPINIQLPPNRYPGG